MQSFLHRTSKHKKSHSYTLWETPFTLKKISLTLILLLLPLSIFMGYHFFTALTLADTSHSFDVVVVGGGTSGVSAAIQAARSGASVAVIEETDWVGGQMTAAGVGTLDEGMDFSTNPASGYERNSGIYKEFLDQVTSRYGGIQNMHKCYYGNFAICFEPKIGQDILSGMLANAGVQVFLRTKVTTALKTNTTVIGVVAHNAVTNTTDQFNAKVVIDATEYGDVIPLTGAAYRVGRSISSAIDLNAPIQDITYKAIIKRYDSGIPANLKITQEPPNYQAAKAGFAQFISPTAPIRDWGDGVTSPYTNPRSWVQYIAYRGIADSTRPSNTTAANYSQAGTITKTGINLSNDYPATVRFLEDPTNRTQVTCEAKLKTIQMLYYIQQEMGQSWSVDTDEGFDTSYNQSENNCATIPAAFKEIEKRMPLIPYVRESRRIIGISTMTSSSIKAQKTVNRSDTAAVNAVDDTTAIALGGYTTDLHCTGGAACTQDQFDGSIDSVSDMLPDLHSLFQIPMGSLIPESVDGFLAAEKNISQGRIANGATRLQPITMLTGQAAGALAALAAKTNRQPRAIPPIEVQRVLIAANSPLTLYSFSDAPQGSPFWQSIHLASLYGIMTGNGGTFATADILDRGTTAVILTRLFSIPTNGTVDDAINQLRARGMTTAATNTGFNAATPVLKGQLALFIARGMKQNLSSAADAITYLTSQGISVGCSSTSCETDTVSRGQMAESVATAIGKLPASAGFSETQPQTPPTSLPAPQLIGWQDYVTPTGSLVGWACDKAHNTSPVRVDIYIDGGGFGQFIGTAQADRHGDDAVTIGQLCGGSGDRRYIFQIPDSLRNAGTHTIYTYAVATNDRGYIKVPNSGQNFSLGNKDPFGYSDYVDTTGRVLGWACDPDDFNQALRVDFYLDGPAGQGTLIGSTQATIPDENAVGYFCGGVNAHRFAWKLPDTALSGTHQLYSYGVNIGTGTSQLLGSSPLSTSDRKQAPAGL